MSFLLFYSHFLLFYFLSLSFFSFFLSFFNPVQEFPYYCIIIIFLLRELLFGKSTL
jgi:hypothetical protein